LFWDQTKLWKFRIWNPCVIKIWLMKLKFLFKLHLNLLTTSHVTIKAASNLLDLSVQRAVAVFFHYRPRILVLRSSLTLISHFRLPAVPDIISIPDVPEVTSSLVLSLFSLYWYFLPFFTHFIGDSVDWSLEGQLYYLLLIL
jgi:hypothetical protein